MLSQGLRLNLKPEGLTQLKGEGKSMTARGHSTCKDPEEGMLGKLKEEDRRPARLEAGKEMGDEEEMMKMLDSAVTMRSLDLYFRCDAVMNWVPQKQSLRQVVYMGDDFKK